MDCWEPPMVMMLRYIIGDMDTPYKYSDTKLRDILILSAFLIQREIKFDANYTINITSMSINPDPVEANDVPFINLTVLKAGCNLSRNELKQAADGAILWKDAQSSLDGTLKTGAQKMVTDNICGEYEEAKLQTLIGDNCPGRIVLGPFSSDNIRHDYNSGPFSSIYGFDYGRNITESSNGS